MFLMYVDESGDIGTENSPTNYFILSAMIFQNVITVVTQKSNQKIRYLIGPGED